MVERYYKEQACHQAIGILAAKSRLECGHDRGGGSRLQGCKSFTDENSKERTGVSLHKVVESNRQQNRNTSGLKLSLLHYTSCNTCMSEMAKMVEE